VGVEEGDDRVLLSVSDNGPGVPMGETELIFERYYRSIESPTMPGSVGIGLAVSRQLAELMDGTLEYIPGDWGRFVLSLPSYASVDPVDSSISAWRLLYFATVHRLASSIGAMSSIRRKRILVAAGAVLVLLIGTIAALGYQAWNDVNRVSIERPPSEQPSGGNDDEEEPGEEFPLPADTEGVNIFLLVGSDSRDDLDNLEGFGAFAGQRADVVMVLIRVEGGAAILS